MPRKRMGMLATLLVTVIATVTYQHQTGGGGAPAIDYVVDDYVAAGGSQNLQCLSLSHCLSSTATNIARVIRSSDSAELDYGCDPSTGRTNEATINSHCAGTNCFVHTVYDQCAPAQNVTAAASGNRCKIYDSVTGLVKVGSLVGCNGVNTGMQARADALGLSGSPAVTMAYGIRGPPAATKIVHLVGAGSAFSSGVVSDRPFIGASTIVVTGWRSFANDTPVTDYATYIARHPASANYDATTMRMDGADLAGFGSLSASMAMNNTLIRAYGVGSDSTGVFMDTLLVFGENLTGAPLAAVEAHFAAAKVLSGYTAVAPGPRLIALGQSNAAYLDVPVHGPAIAPGWLWRESASPGSAIAYWATGGAGFNHILNLVKAVPAGQPFAILFAQGESDTTGDDALAAAHQGAFHTLITDLESQSGRTDGYWAICTLHADLNIGTAPRRDTVRAGLVAESGLLGARSAVITPDLYGPLVDGTHWGADSQNTATQVGVMNQAISLVTAYFGL